MRFSTGFPEKGLFAESAVISPLSLSQFALLSLVLICLVLFGTASGRASAQEPFKRHITIYGNSPLLDRYPRDIARTYDLVITEWWKAASAAKIKRINPEIKMIFYRCLIGLQPSYDDWAEVSKHPSWFLRDSVTEKPLVHKRFGWYLMDIANPDFRHHLLLYLERKLVAQPVFDGVFLDDVPGSIAPRDFVLEGTTVPGAISPDWMRVYKGAVATFLKELKTAISGKQIIINGYDYSEYAPHVDGLMLEGFVHGDWQAVDYYADSARWVSDMQALARLSKLRKLVLVQSGSKGTGDALQKQFLFCFASFLLLCDQNTYFYFDSPESRIRPLPFPQLVQRLGPASEPAPSSFGSTTTRHPASSGLKEWIASGSVMADPINGDAVLKFASNGGRGAYAARCISLPPSNGGVLTISCSAKGSNVHEGSKNWMRFALLGKFYDVNHEVLQAGVDLPFDVGTYDWKTYNVSYPVPPGAKKYCVSSLGFYPSSTGTGWVRNLKIESTVPSSKRLKRAFQKGAVLVNPTNVPTASGVEQQPELPALTGALIAK